MSGEEFLPELGEAALLVEALAAATNRTPGEVLLRLLGEQRSPGSNVGGELERRRIRPHVWSGELERFYAETDAFLYESICWNRTGEKRRMRSWIAGWLERTHSPGARVLAYGDGPGFDGLALARRGYEVHVVETSGPARRFASALSAPGDAPTAHLAALPGNETHGYDAILCLDVLEHIPDPAETIVRLVGHLAESGSLVVHAPFWYLGSRVPTHLRCHRRWAGGWRRLFGQAGLVPADARAFWNPIVFRRAFHAGASFPGAGARFRIGAGAALLSSARVFGPIHNWTAERLATPPPWPELESLARGASPADAPAAR